MATAQEIRDRIGNLQEQLKAVESKERASALKTAKELVSRYGLTASELGLKLVPKKRTQEKQRAERPAIYRNPKTGATWNGWGKPPAWMPKDKTKREKYLIAAEGASPEARANVGKDSPKDQATTGLAGSGTQVKSRAVAKGASGKKPAAKKAAPKGRPSAKARGTTAKVATATGAGEAQVK